MRIAIRLLIHVSCCIIYNIASAQTFDKNITAANGQFIGFKEFRPTDYTTSTAKHPLIIFLHGVGEKGNGTTDLHHINCCGIPAYIYHFNNPMRFTWNGKTESFVVLSPQLSPNYYQWPAYYVEEMIKYAVKNLRIDPDRIFLTGLSLGGNGTWIYASATQEYASALAGIAPVVGQCVISNACNIAKANLPVLAISALDDKTAPPSCTIDAIKAINDCHPSVTPNLIMYTSGGHGVWSQKAFDTAHNYQDPNMFEWMLAQNRKYLPNKKPIANAGDNVAVSATVGKVMLSGAGSRDPDGNILRYSWRKIAGPAAGTIGAANTSTPAINGLTTKGTYKYELKVVDNRAEWSLDTVIIVSGDSNSLPNIKPVANAGEDIIITAPENNATLDASSSFDPDGNTLTYLWTEINGTASIIADNRKAKTKVSGLTIGNHIFKVTATDKDGAKDSDEVSITVIPGTNTTEPNKPPAAIAGNDTTIYLPDNTVELNGSASYDTDGNITSYKWKKISGPADVTIEAETAISTSVQFADAGTYSFVLTVRDNGGASSTDTVNVEVADNRKTEEKFNLYPNPGRGIVNLQISSSAIGKTSILIYDVTGSLIQKQGIQKTTFDYTQQLIIVKLKRGMYFLEIALPDSKKKILRFVKE